ncbi:hypothetical protein LTR36_004927 [Oleoguttula mirabilis]|uniref:RGS-domain-containing protein n=1 Tax=Oleoguttula mirabilis TaxID=1507867 RepID=A0AAV9JWB6_9PEZI|nr:hypothetical protein LTR36_004927 [Oleoguttula mirabilis]
MSLLHTFLTRLAASTADTVDSKAKATSRAHSRLPSFGRIRSRGSIQSSVKQQQQQRSAGAATALPSQRDETFRVKHVVPVSALDASLHKTSDTSTLSNTPSESSLSDDKSDDTKSIDDRPSKPAFWLTSSHTPGELARDYDEYEHADRYQKALQQRPRMMHQTSSRLLRMTEDERPFTRDFKDLFSTLMVSLPLTPHRVRFSRIEHTFTTEEAITNLGSLKFSQSNRMPDPKDPSRIVTTTTTTTFSMAKEMARSVCMRFLEARFVESVDGKTDFSSRGSVWQLTPKGMHILARFCQRNGIHQRHVNELLDSPRNMMQLVILERESDTDKLNSDAATVHVVFRRFAGDTGPNLKSNPSTSDSDSMNDYATGLIGVKMQRSRRNDKDAPYTFTGKAAFDWLMDCCTVVDKREVFELANLFLQHDLIILAGGEGSASVANGQQRFAASKHVLYAITQKGMRVAGWITSPNGSVNGEATVQQRLPNGVMRDSNTNRMTVIIRDPALRLLFREYLRETHCEENLAFYVEVKAFLSEYERAKREASPPRLDVIRETLASAYSLYNAFLAPGSPCELNIDHNLRNALAGRMTRAVGEDEQMLQSLDEVGVLFDQAQSSVFKLMASDSVPKFSREPKYAAMLRERNLESMLSSFASTSIS